MTKDVIDAIRERRSIRRFQSELIPEATIGRILESARLAPSIGNSQPWLFVVVRDEARRGALAASTRGEDFVAAAPAVIVVCIDLALATQHYGPGDKALLALQDAGAAIENMLLACTAFGLGSCWVGAVDDAKAGQVLGLDAGRYRTVALVPVGYAAEEPEPPATRSMDELVRVLS